MLVLVSFGLVLLATILLVVGLLSDDGLTLIYISIACSATAAVVLYLAFRMARPKGERDATPPAPIAGGPADEEAYPDPTRVGPAVASPAAEAPAVAAAAPAPAPAAATAVAEREEPAVAEAALADTADRGWAEQGVAEAGWDEAGEPEFPIADYDELKVSEIMPLLPQLYSDELEIVAERERSTKNRSTILSRLAELEEEGTEADALEQMAQAESVTVEAGEPEAFEPPPARAAEPETRVVPAVAPTVSLSDDEDDDYLFPIADYDELSVSQIMPLLPQLELDELEDVKERELAGAGRKSLITEIDRYLSGELEPYTWDEDEDVPAAEPAPAPEPAIEPEPAAPTPLATPTGAALPIDDYDSLNVADIRPLLSDLSPAELEAVLEHEAARDNRKTIVNDIERRLESAAPAAATRASSNKRKATPKKRKATPKKVAAKKSARKARKATKKAATPRFPIAGYDDLTVAEIRPRLTDLSDRELRLVREREAAGAGRKTILKDIDNRLS